MSIAILLYSLRFTDILKAAMSAMSMLVVAAENSEDSDSGSADEHHMSKISIEIPETGKISF